MIQWILCDGILDRRLATCSDGSLGCKLVTSHESVVG